MTDDQILSAGRRAIGLEREALARLEGHLGEGFCGLVRAIIALPASGKTVITGMGKSGLIARKIAATLSSTGTLALFLHPAEGVHGDLGIVQSGDVVIALSKSGETAEIIALLPSLRRIGARLASFTGNVRSSLARSSDFVIDASVSQEACPLNLAPTASTTAALALGDALATVLLQLRGFTEERFALYHPGGSLGARLLTTCEDLMIGGEENPVVTRATAMKDVLIEMTGKPLGGVSVVDDEGRICGVITDGDLRRALNAGRPVLDLRAEDLMTPAPMVILRSARATEALDLMENRERKVLVLPVVDAEGRPVGMLRLHDLIAAGL